MKAPRNDDAELLELEGEALVMLNGHPNVRAMFEELTESGAIHLRTNPVPENLTWDTRGVPASDDLSRDAAIRLLMDLDYVSAVERAGRSDYVAHASDKAKEVRSLYDALPERQGAGAAEFAPAAP